MSQPMLDENIQNQVREVFAELDQPVELLFFGSQTQCDYCEPALQLLQEVAALSDRLQVSAYDLDAHADLAAQYHVDAAPTMVIAARNGDALLDYGIRFMGIPSGHEFSTLISDLITVSRRDSGLSKETREFLAGLEKPVHLQVFVTPTCPYCPRAVVLAHAMAMENPLVQAVGIEATEFPELAEQYGVSGVPHTTVNFGASDLIGAAPEAQLVQKIREALLAV